MSNSIIHILDENTANKISAGEVVERPASVIKELVENSLDAQATNIEIEIRDGGTTFIRVSDNGIGMSGQDAQLAILRHATSKINSVDDLTHILSLGFRGEALPSIAAVSKFRLITRNSVNNFATVINVEGGIITEKEEIGAQLGTTITVSDIFYNTPARRKFLKSVSTECSNIHTITTKLALSHPEVSFKLINNQRLVLSTPGNNSLSDTITALYGHQYESDLLCITYNNDDLVISGYVGKPTSLKSNRAWQTFLVNSRVVQSKLITKAVDNAYHSLLPSSGYPLIILNITIPANSIDVNVHPQKAEVKFSNDKKIFHAVYHAVITSLQQHKSLQSFSTTAQLNQAKPIQNNYLMPQQPNIKPQLIQLHEDIIPFSQVLTQKQAQDQAYPFSTIGAQDHLTADADQSNSSFSLYPVGQIDNLYIIALGNDGLYVIDQHAAHERILFDKFSCYSSRIPVQQILIPPFFEFDNNEISIINEYNELFYQLGLTLEAAGPNTMRLTEKPTDIIESEIEQFIREVLILLQDNHKPAANELRLSALQMAACRSAIKAGELLNMRQMQALLDELCTTSLPYSCPHGRPAIIRFSSQELAKMFKRT